MHLVRISDSLPADFEVLRHEAETEGHRNLSRLAEERAAGSTSYLALLAAMESGRLVAIGGLTPEPSATPEPALRLRRVYVSRPARRTGVGRTLVNALLQEALAKVRLVTVNAHPGSTAFWTAMDFTAVAGRAWTHELRRDYSAA